MNKYVAFLCAFILLGTAKSFPQQKEWQKIVYLLKEEGRYFVGKNGHIRLAKQKYNTFTVEDYTIQDTLFNVELKLFDRYENIPGIKEKKQERSFDWGWGIPMIKGAEIMFGSDFYFEDYPESVFLRLRFSEEFLITNEGMLIKAEADWDNYTFCLPVRMQKMDKILNAITAYQKKLLQYELERDRTH